MIEGLSHSGDQYMEAITSLKSRYDRPRLIHQTHVRKIYEVASLKEGSVTLLAQCALLTLQVRALFKLKF